MRKSFSILTLLILVNQILPGQNGEFLKQGFNYSYIQLPQNPLPKFNRTYQVKRTIYTDLQTAYKDTVFFQDIIIEGFEESFSNPYLTIELNFEKPVIINKFAISDFDKNNTNRTTQYYPTWTYNQKVICIIKNSKNEVVAEYKLEEKRKFKAAGMGNMQYAEELLKKPLDVRIDYAKDAINFFQKKLNDVINKDFGFMTIKGSDSLLVWNNPENPEFTQMKSNNTKVTNIFNDMTSSSETKKIYQELQDVVEFYNSMDDKYNVDIINFKKIKFTAYFNLIKIYYYLDLPNEAFKVINKLKNVTNDQNIIDNLVRESYDLKKLMEKNLIQSRHFNVETKRIPKPKVEKKLYSIDEDKRYAKATIYYKKGKPEITYINKVHPNQLKTSLTIKLKSKEDKYVDKIIYARDVDSIKYLNGDLLIGLLFNARLPNPKDQLKPYTEANDTYFVKEKYKGKNYSAYQFLATEAIIYSNKTKNFEVTSSDIWKTNPNSRFKELAISCQELISKNDLQTFNAQLESVVEFVKLIDECK